MTPFREDAAVLFDAAEQTYVAVGSKHEELSLRGQAPNGSAVRDDSLFKTYCMTRPLLAVVALAVLGRDALDVPIAQLSDSRVLINRRERLRDVLEHRVRVSQLSVGDVLLSEPARTRSMTVSALSEPSIRLSVPEYSDLVPWEILNELIVARTGTGLLEQIRTRVVEPLALDRHLCFQVDEDLAEDVVDRFVPLLVKTRTSRWLPLVSDATPYFLHHTIGPTISALNSAFGMGRIFRELFIDRCRNLALRGEGWLAASHSCGGGSLPFDPGVEEEP